MEPHSPHPFSSGKSQHFYMWFQIYAEWGKMTWENTRRVSLVLNRQLPGVHGRPEHGLSTEKGEEAR
jgi:hypothetical protein